MGKRSKKKGTKKEPEPGPPKGSKNDDDLDLGELRLLRDLMRAMDVKVAAHTAERGWPPLAPRTEDEFHCTLIDDDLFAPPPPRPDCPICFLTLPSESNCTYHPCCGKSLCDGCIYAHRDLSHDFCCPFCRAPCKVRDSQCIKLLKKRIEANDMKAIYMMGTHCLQGIMGVKQDHGKALELFHRAAELGLNAAHHSLSMLYAKGAGMEKNEKKSLHHMRLAAIGGMPEARFYLGVKANESGNLQLAMKHWIIGAEAGHDGSLNAIKIGYAQGKVAKEVYAKALRANKTATDEMRSDQRDRAAKLTAGQRTKYSF